MEHTAKKGQLMQEGIQSIKFYQQRLLNLC